MHSSASRAASNSTPLLCRRYGIHVASACGYGHITAPQASPSQFFDELFSQSVGWLRLARPAVARVASRSQCSGPDPAEPM